MFAQSIPPLTPRAPLSSGSQERSSTGFQGALAQAQQRVAVSGTGAFDPVDEERALGELFHLLAYLSVGRVDVGLLAQEDRRGQTPPGPVRQEVEALKAVLRRLLRGPGQAAVLDPLTGLPVAGSGGEANLASLVSSLPREIQNLLRRAFPDLDERVAAERAKGAGKEPLPLDPGAPAQYPMAFLARLLDALQETAHAGTRQDEAVEAAEAAEAEMPSGWS